jgi:predicted ATPase
LAPLLNTATPVKQVRLSDQARVFWDEANAQYQLKGLLLEYEVSGQFREFDALSDGTKRLVYVISEVATPQWRFADTDGRLQLEVSDRSKIILLEEPELGIHPHQLHLLLGLIRNVARQHQVIITTHSPQVLDMLYADELDRIIICELKDPKKGTQFKRLTKAKIEKAKRYIKEVGHLSDFWMHSNMEDAD